MHEDLLVFYVDSKGAVALANERGQKYLRDSGAGGAVDVEVALGVPYTRLCDAARDKIRLPTRVGFVAVDALVDAVGEASGIIVHAESPGPAVPGTLDKIDRMMEIVAGRDPAMTAAIAIAERLARARLPVLIVAEDGAGAPRLARFIHAVTRRDLPLLEIDARSLAESEALESLTKRGSANTIGTLFVRAIKEASVETQTELARAYVSGALGETRLVVWARSDLRTRNDPSTSPELTRLLRASTLALPPLRERHDRTHVADLMLGSLAPGKTLSPSVRQILDGYPFPGNLAELELVLARASAHAATRNVIEPEDLPSELVEAPKSAGTRRDAEKSAVEEALRQSNGNLSSAAKRLGVARSTLYRMIDKHGITV